MPVQRKVLFQWIGFYENHGGEWLKDFPWRECSFHWSGAMTDSDVLGAASSVFHDVYLQNEATELWAGSGTWNPEIWGALIAPTAIHELRHLYQRKKMGLLIYAMLALPGIRCFTLERDAAAVAGQAEKPLRRNVTGLPWRCATRSGSGRLTLNSRGCHPTVISS